MSNQTQPTEGNESIFLYDRDISIINLKGITHVTELGGHDLNFWKGSEIAKTYHYNSWTELTNDKDMIEELLNAPITLKVDEAGNVVMSAEMLLKLIYEANSMDIVISAGDENIEVSSTVGHSTSKGMKVTNVVTKQEIVLSVGDVDKVVIS